MPIERAKPLASLYDEVGDYDLVLVPDSPLADALNRHLDRPHVGDFATTPRRLAAGRREESEERTVFLGLRHETDLSWKQAAHLGEEIIHCWEYTGRPDAILEYDRFDEPVVERAVAQVRRLDTTARHLADYTVDSAVDLAVVGYPQLTALERTILPADYDRVDRFTDGSFEIPSFRLFDSAAAMIDSLVSELSAESAGETAIVLDADGEFSPLVESALSAAEIPFYGGPGFLDDRGHRTFLGLLRAAFRGRDVRVGAVRPLLQHLGYDVGVENDEKRVHALDAPEAQRFGEWCDAIRTGDRSFETALTEYERILGDAEFETFHEELRALGLASRPITKSTVDDLEFYLQSYDVPTTRENEGVLLADADAATHVDRPLVFFLGVDDGWTRTPPRRPWVDRDAEFDRHLRQFQLLLQNGTDRHYLVRDTVGGQPVTPCLYFEELLDESFSRFSDLDAERFTALRERDASGFDSHDVPVTPSENARLSQSSLNAYVNSPRDYLFDRLVDSPETGALRKGSLFHEFAEFYAHHPDVVPEARFDEVVDLMIEEMEPFVRDVDRAVHRTRYRAGVENVVDFLDEYAPDTGTLALDGGAGQENTFASAFGHPIGGDVTERWFENDDIGIEGKIDLLQSPTRLVDYKSGSKKSATTVVKNSAVDEPSDAPDFQALLYLTQQRSQQPGETLEFVFVHFLDNVDDVVRGEASLDDTLTTITYHPTEYAAYIRREETFQRLVTEGANACRKTLSQVSYGTYRDVFDDVDVPQTRESDVLIDSAFGVAFTDAMKAAVGEYRYVEKGCKQAMRELIRIRKRNYFSDEVDAFEAFVERRLAEVNRRRAGEERFPISDLLDEPNYRRVDHRDLLLEER